jgi:hypothetical protein
LVAVVVVVQDVPLRLVTTHPVAVAVLVDMLRSGSQQHHLLQLKPLQLVPEEQVLRRRELPVERLHSVLIAVQVAVAVATQPRIRLFWFLLLAVHPV